MERPPTGKFVVHCTFSEAPADCAEQAQIYRLEQNTLRRTTFHRLIDGDFLAIQIHIHNDRRPCSVKLARVLWIHGDRFGVELLMMDADERIRLTRFLETPPSLGLAFQDTRPELVISAAE